MNLCKLIAYFKSCKWRILFKTKLHEGRMQSFYWSHHIGLLMRSHQSEDEAAQNLIRDVEDSFT